MRVLWTLYLTFAYLVYAIVLFLVVGFRRLRPLEWTGVAGGPVLIYTVRTTLAAFFNFRIETLSTRLKDQQAERANTIQKLKDATRYDSTQELLTKYGGGEDKSPQDKDRGPSSEQARRAARNPEKGPEAEAPKTNMPPPPTANIRRPGGPGTPQQGSPAPPHGPFHSPPQLQHNPAPEFTPEVSAEFAPNAFGPGGAPPPTQYAPASALAPGVAEPHWYDRILDLLLGEDETAAKNRLVLICSHCRLVNGQAPPGAKTLADVGSWKCMACGTTNGEVDEGKRIVEEVIGASSQQRAQSADGDSSDLVEVENEEGESAEDESEPRRRTRGQRSGSKKKGGK